MKPKTIWVTGVELAEQGAKVTTFPILPVGKVWIERYGTLDLSQAVMDELISNFDARVLKTDIRIDFEHDFREAAGWITALTMGEFKHPQTGKMVPALMATVEWTPTGITALSEKTYRYVSAAFGPYKDEETKKTYPNVLKATALTNDPAMKMLPPVELSDDVRNAEHVTLGDVVDAIIEDEKGDLPPELCAASDGIWEALDAYRELVKQALADGLTGDALRARLDELSADMTDAMLLAMSSSVQEAADGGGDMAPMAPAAPVAQVDPTLSDGFTGGTRPVHVSHTASTAKEVDVNELEKAQEERDLAVTALNARLAADRKAQVGTVLAHLSEVGLDEATRKRLETVLSAEPGSDVLLSEGAAPVAREDALLVALSEATIVPVGTVTGTEGEIVPPVNGGVELTDSEKKVAKILGLPEADVLAAKKTAEEV